MSTPYAKLPGWADYGLIPVVNLFIAFVVAGLVVLLVGENPLRAAVIPAPFIDVPRQQRAAHGIREHPAVTAIHAVLEEQVARDVVTRCETLRLKVACVVKLIDAVGQWRHDVLHHAVSTRILNPEWFAFGV